MCRGIHQAAPSDEARAAYTDVVYWRRPRGDTSTMCKDKTDDRNGGNGGGRDPRGGFFPHIGHMPERRPIRRGGGLWGGPDDEHPRRFTLAPLVVLVTLACKTRNVRTFRHETWLQERQVGLTNEWDRDSKGRRKPPRDGKVWFTPALLVITRLAMCGQKRYFGDDRTDEHILFKRDLDMRRRTRESKKRMKDDDDRPHPWSWAVARLARRPIGA